MTKHVVARRSMLMGVGALAVAGAALPAVAANATTPSAGDGLVGAWLITRRDKGATTSVQAVVTFADGGAFATTDINPAAPGAIGGWVSAGDHAFRAEFWIGSAAPDGTPVVVKVQPRGQWSGDEIEGGYQVDVNAGGHHSHSSGTFHGTRVEP